MSTSYALQVELSKKKIFALRKALETRKSAFSEKRYLESLGPPVTIIGREKEAKQILEFLYSPNSFLVPLVSVYGRSGTGKSTVVRLVCNNLEDLVSYSYVNLRKARTIFGCANLILSELDTDTIKSTQGINKAVDKIESRIIETLELDNKKQFILILDEFDVIFSDSRGLPSDFVFKLLNIVENLRAKGLDLCIVALSNCSLADFSLDDRVKSRMDNCEVFFAPYTNDEIFSILKERSKKAFVGKINEKVLTLCSKLSGDEHGDCRRALQLLRVAGEIAGGAVLSEDHVKEAAKKLDDDKLDSILASATNHQRLLLAALAKLVLHSGKASHSTREIFDVYCSLCEKIKFLSCRSVFNLLVELENTSIIIAKKHSTGRHGYHNFYEFTFDYRLVGWILDKNWWTSEKDDKEKSDILDDIVYDELHPGKKYERSLAYGRASKRYQKRFEL